MTPNDFNELEFDECAYLKESIVVSSKVFSRFRSIRML